MKVLGIIPARGGSKRAPRKNIADLDGKPLIQWTIESAILSGVFTDLVVSTEDEEIGLIANKISNDIWLPRAKRLARDETPMIDVVREVHNEMGGDVVIVLQPTSPLRSYEDIQQSLALFNHTGADAVISVTEAPDDLVFEVGHARRLRKAPDVMVPNGAIFIISNESLSSGLTWFTTPFLYGYVMSKDRSIDIDTQLDLELTRHIIRVKNGLTHEVH